jgi:hypothetical protein
MIVRRIREALMRLAAARKAASPHAPAGFSPPWNPHTPAPPLNRNPQGGKNPLPRPLVWCAQHVCSRTGRSCKGHGGSPRAPVRPGLTRRLQDWIRLRFARKASTRAGTSGSTFLAPY